MGVAGTLFDRASYIVKDQEQLYIERKHIKTTLKQCGYKSWALINLTVLVVWGALCGFKCACGLKQVLLGLPS